MIYYLATPYSSKHAMDRELRYQQACVIAGTLMAEGKTVYSPIAHSHNIAAVSDLPTSWDFWGAQCIDMLRACSVLIVAKMPGWEQSVGVRAEIALAGELGIPIEYLEV